MAGTVRLYRTVSVPEYDDLRATGAFRPKGSTEGKWFWTTRRDAGRFGSDTSGHDHPGGYRVVVADVPEATVERSVQPSRLDGIGLAAFVI